MADRHKTRYPGVYYRETATGKRRYQIVFTGSDGKQHWETVEGGEKDALRRRNLILERLASGHKVEPRKVKFQAWAEKWLEGQSLEPNTMKSYRASLKTHLIPRLGHRNVSSITISDVARLVADMKLEGKKYWTIRASLTVLSRVMAAAVREGIAGNNPVKYLERSERPKNDQAEMEILDSNEIQLMLTNAPEKYRLLFETAVFTGLRIGELLALTWDDIDFERSVLRVRKSKTKAGIREVVLPPFLVKKLAAHSLAQPPDTKHVFTDKDGIPLLADTVRLALHGTLERAGIEKHVRFHDLRHTYASLMIGQGHDVTFVSRQMGHSNPSVTLTTYAKLFNPEEQMEKARDALEAAFGGMSS